MMMMIVSGFDCRSNYSEDSDFCLASGSLLQTICLLSSGKNKALIGIDADYGTLALVHTHSPPSPPPPLRLV